MPNIDDLRSAVERTAEGDRDTSGKTPLDGVFEQFDFASKPVVTEFVRIMSELYPWLVQKGPSYLKLGRQILRRAKIRDRALAVMLERLVREEPSSSDTERRLWISLALMDLGYPRSVASLRGDQALRRGHIGEWLSLI